MGAGLSRATAEARLRWAIDHHESRLLYEPVLTVREGTLAGVRARLHWDDPHRGAVPPREFIPALEDTGLILEVGMWALGEACNDARRWRLLAPERVPLQVIMPITARQLAQSNFRDLVAAVLSNTPPFGHAARCSQPNATIRRPPTPSSVWKRVLRR